MRFDRIAQYCMPMSCHECVSVGMCVFVYVLQKFCMWYRCAELNSVFGDVVYGSAYATVKIFYESCHAHCSNYTNK